MCIEQDVQVTHAQNPGHLYSVTIRQNARWAEALFAVPPLRQDEETVVRTDQHVAVGCSVAKSATAHQNGRQFRNISQIGIGDIASSGPGDTLQPVVASDHAVTAPQVLYRTPAAFRGDPSPRCKTWCDV